MPSVRSFSRIITDETMMENVRHGDASFPFQYYYEDIWDFDLHCVDWHWHPELEYVYVRSGRAVCLIAGEKVTVPAGKALLINSRVIHRFEAEGSTVIPNAVYSPFLLAPEGSRVYQKYIYPFTARGPGFLLFDPAVPWENTCIRQMNRVFEIQEKQGGNEIGTVALLLAFWEELTRHWHSDSVKKETAPDRTNQVRLQIMMQYIQEHYQENIRLEDIADTVHIGKSTALQIFQKGIHQPPVAYLIRYRLKQAAVLLTTTEKKITGIAEETGFESSTYFCRKFRELYGMTPKDYRNGSA